MSTDHSKKTIDALYVVSKVLADQRILELRRENEHLRSENEHLRLQLFWRDYSKRELESAMAFANQKETGPRCTCIACMVSGRTESTDDPHRFSNICRFRHYWEHLLRECGLVVHRGLPQSLTPGASADVLAQSIDAHIISYGRHDWCSAWAYGARLWRGTSVDDPELKKLQTLFERLCYTPSSAESE